MAFIVDHQQSTLKHFCKICQKGFGCGRALGGHMRAHGIADHTWHVEDDDPASYWEDKLDAAAGPTTKRMYALRTNPNRLKSCRVCENCGKEFLSWKSFLEHGKCTSDVDADSPASSWGSDGDVGDDHRGCGWSKRKRSFRSAKLGIGIGNFNSVNCPSSEEEDLANCLMMLSNAAAVEPLMAEPEESCASASRDEEIRRNPINNFIAPTSYKTNPTMDHKAKAVVPKGLFECKACKKVFNSHQALGGHRASHKKVKGCFASRLHHPDDVSFGADDDVITHEEFLPTKSSYDGYNNSKASLLIGSSSSKRKAKVHECSICHRTFSSGQALGGHKRCHWITSNAPDTSALARFQQFQEQHIIPKFDNNNSSEPLDLKLDLNLPAPADDLAARREISMEIYLQPWMGGTKENANNNTSNNNNNDDNNNNTKNKNNTNFTNSHQRQYRSGNDNVEEDKSNNSNVSLQNVAADEADSKVKLAKLSELKDMNVGGSSSPWLQVGIGSTTGVGEL